MGGIVQDEHEGATLVGADDGESVRNARWHDDGWAARTADEFSLGRLHALLARDGVQHLGSGMVMHAGLRPWGHDRLHVGGGILGASVGNQRADLRCMCPATGPIPWLSDAQQPY